MSTPASYSLRQWLTVKDSELLSEVESLIARVTPLLWRTLSTFPTGTDHTPNHTHAVEQNAGLLLSDELLAELQSDEIALVILGCHFHDLGMAGTEADNINTLTQEQARRDHAIRIGDRIRDNWSDLGFRDESFALALAEVCRGHRPKRHDGKATWSDIRERAIVGPNRPVRLRLISALVYAADELHITADRAQIFEQQWMRLQSDEARKHWKRHQCIFGPVFDNGTVSFEAHLSTFSFERDLRKYCFEKAFTSVRDAQDELTRQSIKSTLPKMAVNWVRDETWRLQILAVLADMRGRTAEVITNEVYAQFAVATESFVSLTEYCEETPTAEVDVKSSIRRVIDAYRTQSYLSDSDDSFVLDTGIKSNIEFSRITRLADECDVLLDGRYASHHEFDLLKSDYGRMFAIHSLTPLITANFGVDLTTDKSEWAVRVLIESSPTARRLLIEAPPAPSILVKRHLLRSSAISGASLDLLRCPEIMLQQEFRQAIRHLSGTQSSGQLDFLRFIEELILVDGYSLEQVREAVLHSEEELEALKSSVPLNSPTNGNTKELQIKQSIPLDIRAIAVSIPHLWIVGQRTRLPIELLNTKEAPLTISTTGADAAFTENQQPVMMSFAPGPPSAPARVDCRSTLSIDISARTIHLEAQKLTEQIDPTLPLIVSFAMGDIVRQIPNTTMRFGYYVPALNARHLQGLIAIGEMIEEGPIEVRLHGGIGTAVTSMERESAMTWAVDDVDRDIVHFLANAGEDVPYPWHFSVDEFDQLSRSDDSTRQNIYNKYMEMPTSEKEHIHTVILRYANIEGLEYQEEFLGFVGSKTFRPPKSSLMSDDDFNRWWTEGTESATLAMSFSSDMHSLAREVRDWADDSSKPFPLQISGKSPTTPIFKSRFELVWSPIVDRLWYVERPLIMRVRPIRDDEAWNVEGMYWESVGQIERAEILRERLVERAALEQSAGPSV
jgi:hypothetical protein